MPRRTPRGRGFNLSPERSFGYLLRDTSRMLLRRLQHDIEAHSFVPRA